jgi:hypothetical protein
MSSRTNLLCRSVVACLLLLGVGCKHRAVLEQEAPSVRLVSDTVRLGGDIEGDLLGTRSGDSCFAPAVEWSWTLTQIRLAGVGSAKRTGECAPRPFRARMGSLGPMLRPDEPWVATYYRVVACSPNGEPWRRVIVLMVPQSSIEARYGGTRLAPASDDAYALATGDSAKQSDRQYCESRRPR